MKRIVILGSTGSIGVQALDVVDKLGYKVVALAAGKSIDKLEKQIRKYKPALVAVRDGGAAADLKVRVADLPVRVLSGSEGVCECARENADIVLNAIVGMAGLEPTLCALDAGTTVALANKETLVAGGSLVKAKAKEKCVPVLPVDSEHSAIFQALQGMNEKKELKRVILTASGGPFFGRSRSELENVTVEQALKHPNWSMGAKITVDSASMMNKGLELIEAVWLFDVPADMVDIVVHRESVVHSMIEYTDNSVIAQLGVPDMRIPIQYALTYPQRYPSPVKQLDLCSYGALTFSKPDCDTFRTIDLCRKAITEGGAYPAAVNGANEEANLLFRQGKIRFLQIGEAVERVLDSFGWHEITSLDDVLEFDGAAREAVRSFV